MSKNYEVVVKERMSKKYPENLMGGHFEGNHILIFSRN